MYIWQNSRLALSNGLRGSVNSSGPLDLRGHEFDSHRSRRPSVGLVLADLGRVLIFTLIKILLVEEKISSS